MPFANLTMHRGGLVPEGHLRLAQRFNAGKSATKRQVPKGRLNSGARAVPTAVPSGLRPQRTLFPALKRWASLRCPSGTRPRWKPSEFAKGIASSSMNDQVPDMLRVNGRAVIVPAGTVVAAAIARVGVSPFRRSPLGRPCTPLCGMGVCMECRVSIDGRAHCRSCITLCAQGMEVRTDG